ncbi:MAG: lipid-A-disaccharide synthase [Opitutaceae bacterium]
MSETPPFRLPPATADRVDVLIIAGEHSGDEHAARMVRELRTRQPSLTIAALGGPQLAAAGAQLLHDMTASSVVGLVEVLKNYSFFKALFAGTLHWVATHQPRAVCFVDYPGMNLRLAAALRQRGLSRQGGGRIKTLYYISPQIWAWKAKRRFSMARDLDAMAVIFPFEPECYADTALPVEFVGHPFVAPDYRSPVRYDSNGPILLLPGSRKQAVSRIFPALLAGFRAFGRRDAVVLYPSGEILDVLRALSPPPNVQLVQINESHARPEAISASAVLTSSGTMSMHCALAAIPGAIAYRANPVTHLLGRMLVNVEYLGIANLLLGEPVYPEYIQDAATPAALAKELRAATEDGARREHTVAQARRLHSLLRVSATGTAADWMLRQLG